MIFNTKMTPEEIDHAIKMFYRSNGFEVLKWEVCADEIRVEVETLPSRSRTSTSSTSSLASQIAGVERDGARPYS